MRRGTRLHQYAVIMTSLGICFALHAPMARAEDKLPSQAGVQFGAVLPHDSAGNGITDHSNNTGGIQATYTFHMNHWTAAGFEFGQTRYTNNFSGSFGSATVQSNVREVELDFLVHIPDHLKRVHAYGVTGV